MKSLIAIAIVLTACVRNTLEIPCDRRDGIPDSGLEASLQDSPADVVRAPTDAMNEPAPGNDGEPNRCPLVEPCNPITGGLPD